MDKILKWFKIRYFTIINSIALLPAIIAFLFLMLSFLMISFDFSETGTLVKSRLHWLSLKDASTARSIISAIAAGIISLTVFSFSMVMIVLNQAASQMSNRILDKIIGNRSQQWVLGFYIGTIVYALFLLSTIRDIDSGIYVPSLSTYLLIALTIIDIFLFIYFLHFITTSVKYETIIGRIFKQTQAAMEKKCNDTNQVSENPVSLEGIKIKAHKSGIFQGFQEQQLLKLCKKENWIISFIYPNGTFILKGSAFLVINNISAISKECEDEIHVLTNIHSSENIDTNYVYGFRQLKEVAIKALSPGINDPGTAILSLHALADLLAFRFRNLPSNQFRDSDGIMRIVSYEKTPDDFIIEYIYPIWDYGRNDRSIRQEFHLILVQLQKQIDNLLINQLLHKVEKAISDDNTHY